MSRRIPDLTERERQALRLLLRGHDAKSVARHLNLSVNDRLRDARRKLGVSSSREAARLLFEEEGDGPENRAPKQIGVGAATRPAPAAGSARIGSAAVLAGVLAMVLAFAVLLASPAVQSPPAAPVATDATTPAAEASARAWLALVDQSRWDDSWRATGASFRELNTAQVWAHASEKVRVPLGAVVSRTLISQEDVPAPPQGYRLVKFRTSFANKADAVETVTLNREGGEWRVIGIYVG